MTLNCFTERGLKGLAQFGHEMDESVQRFVHPSARGQERARKFNRMNRSEVLDSFQFGASDACTSVEDYALKGSTMKKLSYLFVLFTLILLSASTTRADQLDPLIGGGGTGSCGSLVDLLSLTQMVTITSDELSLGCIVDFKNDTGTLLTSFVVTVDTPFSQVLGCFILPGTSPFSVASPSIPIITDSCTFSGGDGVPNGSRFGLEFGGPGHPFCLNDPTGACQPLSSLDVTLHPTPEPASITLIRTGLAALVARRKKLGSRSPLSNCVC